jgi:hypothetical protein
MKEGKSMNEFTIERNGKTLDIIKDHYIYEVYYKNDNIGYFSESRLNDAVRAITKTGFYDGRDYDYRMMQIDRMPERLVSNAIDKR